MPLFKLPKHRTFNYKPRFYDPEKERVRDIVEAAQGKSNKDDLDAVKRRISRGIVHGKTGRIAARKQVQKSRTRLILIIILLFVVTYFILNFNFESILKIISE